MSDVKSLYGKLQDLINVDTHTPEIVQQVDTIEGENTRIMINISNHILELEKIALKILKVPLSLARAVLASLSIQMPR